MLLSSDLSASFDLSFGKVTDRSSPDRSPIHPKLEVKVGRGVQENARPQSTTQRAHFIYFPMIFA